MIKIVFIRREKINGYVYALSFDWRCHSGIRNVENIITPAVVLAVAVMATIMYSLTKEKYGLLLAATEAKENGQAYATDGLENVL